MLANGQQGGGTGCQARYFELRCKHRRPPPSGFMVMHIGVNAAHTLINRLFS